jgi:hypothetical protein
MPIRRLSGGQPYFDPGTQGTYNAATNQRAAVYMQNWRGLGAWDRWNYGNVGNSYTPLFRDPLRDWTGQEIAIARAQKIPTSPPPISAESYALSNRSAQWGNYFATLPRSMGG